MAAKQNALMEKPVTRGTCKHHWVIEPPNGPTSKGVCKLCGELKLFDNILADLMSNNDNSESFEPDNVIKVEDEVEDS